MTPSAFMILENMTTDFCGFYLKGSFVSQTEDYLRSNEAAPGNLTERNPETAGEALMSNRPPNIYQRDLSNL